MKNVRRTISVTEHTDKQIEEIMKKNLCSYTAIVRAALNQYLSTHGENNA